MTKMSVVTKAKMGNLPEIDTKSVYCTSYVEHEAAFSRMSVKLLHLPVMTKMTVITMTKMSLPEIDTKFAFCMHDVVPDGAFSFF